MNKVFFYSLLVLFPLLSCDKRETMGLVIINSTSQKLSLTFVSSQFKSNSVLEVNPNEKNFDINYLPSIYGVFLTLFVEHDSIYFTNSSNEVLKVYKENDTGKNIYGIEQYWTVEETSKDHFVYTYEITDEDIE